MSCSPLPFNLDQIGAETVLDALADGAYITDRDRRIVFWNRAAERITGWRREDVLGRPCRDNILVHVDKENRPLCGQDHCPLHRAIITGQRSSSPVVVFAQTREGERIAVEVTVSPLRDASGNVMGGIELFRDVTLAIDDLRRAKMVQQHALDSLAKVDARLRIATHYVPQAMLGGDFYRVEKIDENRYGVLLADVTGHGTAAAFYTMQIRSMIEDYRHLLADPLAFVAVLGRRLHVLAGRDDIFTTAVYAVIDAATGTFTYVRAGHTRPIVRRRNGDVAFLDQGGPALGLVKRPEYQAGACTLEPGDTLLLYTDGAVEIWNADECELCEEGLAARLADKDFSNGSEAMLRLEEELLAYSNQIRLPDDLTLVSIYRI